MAEWIIEITDGVPHLQRMTEVVRCKDCKFFETDHMEMINGIPLIVAHRICTKWGLGCRTAADGFCFLAERREECTKVQ